MNAVHLSRDVVLLPPPRRIAEAEIAYVLFPERPSNTDPPAAADAPRPSLVSEAAVLDVLRQLARGRAPVKSPLAGLQIVQRRLMNAGLVPTPRARHLELGRLLDELVATELGQRRQRAGQVWRTPLDGEPEGRLRADFSLGLPELEAWSALHYLYLAPEYALGLDEVAAILSDRHRRTVQRRLSRGVTALAGRLFEVERSQLVPTSSLLPFPRSEYVTPPLSATSPGYEHLYPLSGAAVFVSEPQLAAPASKPLLTAIHQLAELARAELRTVPAGQSGAVVVVLIAPADASEEQHRAV